MNRDQRDEVGPVESHGLFTSTRWGVVQRARDHSEGALCSLFESYRQPLLIWLRARGNQVEDAEDLVQGFFARLLHRDFLDNVSPEKGKFRTFLLTSLKHYLLDQQDKKNAIKRGDGQSVVPLGPPDDNRGPPIDPATTEASPDLEYDRAWARAVLARALERLEEECARLGRAALCDALQPVMFADETSASYREIGEKLGLSESAVKVAAHRVRGRLRGLVRDEILQTVTSEQQWEEEVRYLISLFSR